MIKILIAIILLGSTLSYADNNCIKSSWKNVTKLDEHIGYISLYTTIEENNIEDLLCILGSEFFKNINNFPDKAMIGITNIKTMSGYIALWSISKNTMVITKLDHSTGYSNIYKGTLKMFEQLFLNKQLIGHQYTITTKLSKEQLIKLLTID